MLTSAASSLAVLPAALLTSFATLWLSGG